MKTPKKTAEQLWAETNEVTFTCLTCGHVQTLEHTSERICGQCGVVRNFLVGSREKPSEESRGTPSTPEPQ